MNKIKGQYINNAKGVKTYVGSLDSLPEDLLEDATVLIVETVPVGTVIHSFRTEEPAGYLFCDGQAFDPAKYPELHEVFPDDHVPDLRECGLVCTGLSARPAIANHDTYYVGEFRDDRIAEHKHTATVSDPGHRHTATVSDPGHRHTATVSDPGHRHTANFTTPPHNHSMSHTHTRGTMEITGSFQGDEPVASGAFTGGAELDEGPLDNGRGYMIDFKASNTWTGSTSGPSSLNTGNAQMNIDINTNNASTGVSVGIADSTTGVSVGIGDSTTGVSVDIANTGTGAVTHGKQVGINYFVKAI